MLYDDLRAASVALPIERKALLNILNELTNARSMYSTLEYIDCCRYALRTLGAILPVDTFAIDTIADAAEINQKYFPELLDALMSKDIYQNEISILTLRMLLGLIDDGVKPIRAANSLGISSEEYLWLDSYLNLNQHWMDRILSITETMVYDDASTGDLGQRIGASWWRAWLVKKAIQKRVRAYKRR